MNVHEKLNKLIEKYGSDNEESLVEHLKSRFSKEYKFAIEDLKNDGSDDPDMKMTAGRIADHIEKNEEDFLTNAKNFCPIHKQLFVGFYRITCTRLVHGEIK